MTVHEVTIAKIRQLPESLVDEVNNFIDFLLTKHQSAQGRIEEFELAESDMSDYLSQLEHYEDRLARGEIQW